MRSGLGFLPAAPGGPPEPPEREEMLLEIIPGEVHIKKAVSCGLCVRKKNYFFVLVLERMECFATSGDSCSTIRIALNKRLCTDLGM
jgi:hypothetical protein